MYDQLQCKGMQGIHGVFEDEFRKRNIHAIWMPHALPDKRTVSRGEIHSALAAGFPAERIWFHGDGKTDADIAYALDKGVGCFIVDNGDELISLSEQAAARSLRQKVLLRITPGIDPHTYHAVNTGAVDVKFGVPVETGQAMEFVRAALGMKSLEVAGLHCHVGSMVVDEDVFLRTIDLMVGFMADVRDELGFVFRELNVGGEVLAFVW